MSLCYEIHNLDLSYLKVSMYIKNFFFILFSNINRNIHENLLEIHDNDFIVFIRGCFLKGFCLIISNEMNDMMFNHISLEK